MHQSAKAIEINREHELGEIASHIMMKWRMITPLSKAKVRDGNVEIAMPGSDCEQDQAPYL